MGYDDVLENVMPAIKFLAYTCYRKLPHSERHIISLDDLIQDGVVLALKVADIYDPQEFQTSYVTYVSTCLRNMYKDMLEQKYKRCRLLADYIRYNHQDIFPGPEMPIIVRNLFVRIQEELSGTSLFVLRSFMLPSRKLLAMSLSQGQRGIHGATLARYLRISQATVSSSFSEIRDALSRVSN